MNGRYIILVITVCLLGVFPRVGTCDSHEGGDDSSAVASVMPSRGERACQALFYVISAGTGASVLVMAGGFGLEVLKLQRSLSVRYQMKKLRGDPEKLQTMAEGMVRLDEVFSLVGGGAHLNPKVIGGLANEVPEDTLRFIAANYDDDKYFPAVLSEMLSQQANGAIVTSHLLKYRELVRSHRKTVPLDNNLGAVQMPEESGSVDELHDYLKVMRTRVAPPESFYANATKPVFSEGFRRVLDEKWAEIKSSNKVVLTEFGGRARGGRDIYACEHCQTIAKEYMFLIREKHPSIKAFSVKIEPRKALVRLGTKREGSDKVAILGFWHNFVCVSQEKGNWGVIDPLVFGDAQPHSLADWKKRITVSDGDLIFELRNYK